VPGVVLRKNVHDEHYIQWNILASVASVMRLPKPAVALVVLLCDGFALRCERQSTPVPVGEYLGSTNCVVRTGKS
jgi:hypothetical protein